MINLGKEIIFLQVGNQLENSIRQSLIDVCSIIIKFKNNGKIISPEEITTSTNASLGFVKFFNKENLKLYQMLDEAFVNKAYGLTSDVDLDDNAKHNHLVLLFGSLCSNNKIDYKKSFRSQIVVGFRLFLISLYSKGAIILPYHFIPPFGNHPLH